MQPLPLSSIWFSESDFNRAFGLSKAPQRLKSAFFEILVNGKNSRQLIDRQATDSDKTYLLLQEIFSNLMNPSHSPEVNELDFNRTCSKYRYLRFWNKNALFMVLVQGFRVTDAARLYGIKEQQLNRSLVDFRKKLSSSSQQHTNSYLLMANVPWNQVANLKLMIQKLTSTDSNKK